MIQLGKFVGGWGVVADTNYLYPARWGWINKYMTNAMRFVITFESGRLPLLPQVQKMYMKCIHIFFRQHAEI